MKIYTKVGDGGNTFLAGGRKASKGDARVEALGAVDELNAALGWASALLKDRRVKDSLDVLQRDLFVLGADLAGLPGVSVPRIGPGHAIRLEKEIDAFEASLPPLKNFILPGGAPASAALHLARAVCRRAERALVPLLKKKAVSRDAQIFLNRLSDHLFVLARTANRRAGRRDVPWRPGPHAGRRR